MEPCLISPRHIGLIDREAFCRQRGWNKIAKLCDCTKWSRKRFCVDDPVWNQEISVGDRLYNEHSWWRHQMETFSALLAICAGDSPVPGEFPSQRPVTRSFDVLFDLRLNKRLSKQS